MDLAANRKWNHHREEIARWLKAEVDTVTKAHHSALWYRW